MTGANEESNHSSGAGADPVTGGHDPSSSSSQSTRAATIQTAHEEPSVVAAALRPDHTDALRTRVVSSESVSETGNANDKNPIHDMENGSRDADREQSMQDPPHCGSVVTTIERPSTNGLAATADDYLVNCLVADRVTSIVKRIQDEIQQNDTQQ